MQPLCLFLSDFLQFLNANRNYESNSNVQNIHLPFLLAYPVKLEALERATDFPADDLSS